MREIVIRRPDDWHAHLRNGKLMEDVIGLFNVYGRVVCMGNLADPVDSSEKTFDYQNRIIRLTQGFLPIIGVMLTKNLTVEKLATLTNLFHRGFFLKYMPEGVTTNSELGVPWSELKYFYPQIGFAQNRGIPILIHAEIDKDPLTGKLIDEIDREEAAVPFVAELAGMFPKAIINVEHVSTYMMIELIKSRDNLSGSISPNHMIHNYTRVFGRSGKITNVHRYFKPVAKLQADISAVVSTVLSGNPKFFFASDSAPHYRIDKKKFQRAGAFNALTNLAYLCEFFEQLNSLDAFEPFVSEYGAQRYGFPLNTGVIKLRRQYWKVPNIYHGIVPDLAGRTMGWQVVE